MQQESINAVVEHFAIDDIINGKLAQLKFNFHLIAQIDSLRRAI